MAGVDECVGTRLLTEEQINAVFCAPNPARYDYFIKRVARRKNVWALWESGSWVTATGEDGKECFPVWPAAEFVKLALEAGGKQLWPTATVDKIPLSKWLAAYLPDIEEFGDKIWVFPSRDMAGGLVAPEDMIRDLKKEVASLRQQSASNLQGADLVRARRAALRKIEKQKAGK